MNALVLAYLGDGVYEIYIRKHLIDKGIVKVDLLQKEAIKYVSAKSQSNFIKKLLDNNFLKEDEIDIYLKGRNHKSNHKPKNTDIITYKTATGFEAIIGYLYLQNNITRIKEIINEILKEDN